MGPWSDGEPRREAAGPIAAGPICPDGTTPVYPPAVPSTDAWRPLADSLLGAAVFTARDVALQSGLPLDDTRRLWRALGFPPVEEDAVVFTKADVEILRAVRGLVELQSAHMDDVLQLTRVIGRSLDRVADAQVTTIADRLARGRDDQAPDAIALRELVARIGTLAPSLEHVLGYVWRRHLLSALRRRSAAPSASDRDLTVGFADLVGFTAASQALAPHELTRVVERFEALAYEHVPERGGRVVKMIGDEVMLAVDDPPRAGDIAVALVEACARDPLVPDVRVGLASGRTVAWEGDLYGPTVNLASRLVNLARPGTVLVDDAVGQRVQDDPRFSVKRLRPVALRGVGRMRPWVLRRARAD
jgi:adenylate cyclase